ncbi:MAG: L-serine ammonia-lyase, iron-sulfur-dependent, subunit alpha [Bacilli bacterium]|nr:L-serine ammonia-lyase, iron-sulfur-dependent, subunit alpha [Bacilli bacterium]
MGLRSIKEIFITGHGPSSSHTMGPYFATKYIINKYKDKGIKRIDVTLFGSLALTGAGHLTDKIIELGIKDYEHQVVFDEKTRKKHPNTMNFKIFTEKKTYSENVVSIGGGTIVTSDNVKTLVKKEIYPHKNMSEIEGFCRENKLSFYDYVIKYEDEDITKYFKKALKAMDDAVERGLMAEGYLPGSLKVKRKAKAMYDAMEQTSLGVNDVAMNVAIHSFAVAEENAAGGIIVTAPTCGSAGVIPGCIKYLRMKHVSEDNIIKGLMVAGLFGIVCKTNASVSGAEAGCQAEIGVACSMGAAMIAFCFGKRMTDIIQSAEIALEHSLGLTCDPVEGYVQIPCIERCALYAIKAINAVKLAIIIPDDDIHVSYDDSVRTMYKTGLDMNKKYKETSLGGLAEILK